MHIPDGFLNVQVSSVSAAITAVGLGVAVKRVRKKFSDKTIPIMGVLAAFIFAAQMFNFPVAGGTSGHLIGAVLAAVIVGPMAASIIMAVVLIVQCILFQDGGLLSLGANILNMGIIGSWVGWAVYASTAKFNSNEWMWRFAVFFGAWVSVVAAATICSLELALSGTIPIGVCLPAMVGVHVLIGAVEGLITVMVLSFVKRVRPELIAM